MGTKHRKLNVDWASESAYKEYHRQYRLIKKMEHLIEKQERDRLLYHRLNNLSLADTAYMAGLFDGEGSVSVASGIRKRHGREHHNVRTEHSLHVNISNNHIETLNWIKSTLGLGNIYLQRKNGKCYSWYVSSVRAKEVLSTLVPHLKIKQKQAQLAIKLQEMISRRNINISNKSRVGQIVYLSNEELQERENIRLQIRTLNHS